MSKEETWVSSTRMEHPTPTPTSTATGAGTWTARPVLAWLIRCALVVVPLLAAWLSVRIAVRTVRRPEALEATIGWIVGVVVLSVIVHQIVHRLLRRFSPLGVLFRLSLTFPDAPPSRLGSALRAGRADELHRQLGGDDDAGLDPAMKAQRLASLVARVSRHEVSTRGHSDRVRGYAERIGAQLGLDEADLERLRWAALLHDVGRLDVPRRILDKRGDLDAEERAVVEQHPVRAANHLAPFEEWLGDWRRAATEHHERWDGSGYPNGLRGEEISLAARIVAVADAYDAMTATRTYQRPRSPGAARQELVDNAGTQFDPTVVRAFLECGIRRSRAGLGPLAALVEIPAQLASLTPGLAGGAGAAATGASFAAGAVAAATMVITPATEVDNAPPAVERVVESTTTTSLRPTTPSIASPATARPATTRPPTTTVTAAPTTTVAPPITAAPTTTVAPPTTTAPPTTAAPTTTAAPPTTAAPTTTAPPTTTAAGYPTVGPTTTAGPTTTLPPPPTYPTTGP